MIELSAEDIAAKVKLEQEYGWDAKTFQAATYAYHAGYRAGLERAAKEVDILGAMGPHDEASGWAMACADRIRALL